jgi:hypothetical protein
MILLIVNTFDMKAQFTFTPKSGYNVKDKLFGLLQNPDFLDYLTHSEGQEIFLQLSPAVKTSEKQLMYAYYHGPLLSVAMQAFEDAGYEMMNKLKTDYLLKVQCAASTMVRNGKEEPYLEDKGAMTKDRLRKYITDCIFFLESELDVMNIPDAEEYKNREYYGVKGFRSVRHNKND